MPRLIHACFVAAIAATLISCAPRSRSAGTEPTGQAKEQMDDQYEVPPPRDTVPKVMQAKLAHAQAVLEGIALADYAQIENNALALKRISQGGDWLVQESATYFAFSTEFRSICDDLANHARAQNIQAAAVDYANLANSCVACHSFLRSERQTKDMPGRVSMDGRFHAEGGTLVVDHRNFNKYPAALASFDRAEIIPLPERLDDMRETDADLWIEPGDPEVAAMTAESAKRLLNGGKHLGRDVRLASVALDYDSITTVPSGLTWLARPATDDIRNGGVFIVQSSSDRYFKVRIDTWDRGSRPRAETAADDDKPSVITQIGGLVQLSFAHIREQ